MHEFNIVQLGSLGANRPAAFATGPFGSAVSAKNFQDAGVPMIRGSNLSEDVGVRFDSSDLVFVSEDLASQFNRSIAAPGDLVFTCWGTIGQLGFIEDNGPFSRYLVSNKQMKMTPDKDRVVALYLYYYLSQPKIVSLIKGQSIGSSVPGFNLGQLRELPVALPDLHTQRMIADFLGALDDKIAANDRLANTAQDLADSLFVAGLHQDPGTSVTIGELADRGILAFSDGYRTKRAEHGQPGFRILRAGDIPGGHILPEGVDFVSNVYARQIGQKISQPGDVILTTKGSVGRVAVVPSDLEPVVYSPQICYFRVLDKDALDDSYLAAWFRSSDLQAQAAKLMFKSDMAPYINLRDIRSIIVPVPDRNEQRLRGELQHSLLEIFHFAHSENRKLGRTRDELLPLLMSGKVRIQEAAEIVEGVV